METYPRAEAAGLCHRVLYQKGYCLREAPELLSEKAILDGLQTKFVGRPVVYRERVDSTNNVAKKLADQGAPEGTIIVAEEQTGGRGRINRTFLSPYAKGVWFSLILRPDISPMEVAKMTLLAAVAVARSIRRHGLADCGIKWPNDILVQGRKMVGILTELNGSAEKVNYIIMGIGVNTDIMADDLPEDLKSIVTSFAREGIRVSRLALLETLLAEIERLYDTVCRQGFSQVLAEWRSLSCMLGQEVTVSSVNRTFPAWHGISMRTAISSSIRQPVQKSSWQGIFMSGPSNFLGKDYSRQENSVIIIGVLSTYSRQEIKLCY